MDIYHNPDSVQFVPVVTITRGGEVTVDFDSSYLASYDADGNELDTSDGIVLPDWAMDVTERLASFDAWSTE